MQNLQTLIAENKRLTAENKQQGYQLIELMMDYEELEEYNRALIAGLQQVNAYLTDEGEWKIAPTWEQSRNGWEKNFTLGGESEYERTEISG